jgi:tetratricopeptide (TPR) repeat protein
MKKTLILLLVLIAGASITYGHWPTSKEVTCPLCKHKFTWKYVWSGWVAPPRLDLKPRDPATGKKLPECKKCSFVIYSEKIDPNELAKCKTFIDSNEYKNIKKRSSDHRLAKLYEYLDKDNFEIAITFLEASWQEEDNKKFYRENQDKCLFWLKKYLAAPISKKQSDPNEEAKIKPKSPKWHTAQLLIGEILRQQKQYDKATDHFKTISTIDGFDTEQYKAHIQFELDLCKKKDSQHHYCDEYRIRKNHAQKNSVKGESWGEPNNGLQIRILPEHISCDQREKIEIAVSYRNVTDRVLHLYPMKFMFSFSFAVRDAGLNRLGGGGGTINANIGVLRSGVETKKKVSGSQGDFTVLLPGQTKTEKTICDVPSVGTVPMKARSKTVSASLCMDFDENQTNPADVYQWKGKVRSNRIEIKVDLGKVNPL